MGDILETTFLNTVSGLKFSYYDLVSRDSMENKSSLVDVMALCHIGETSLPKPKMTQLNDEYMRHLASMCQTEVHRVDCMLVS